MYPFTDKIPTKKKSNWINACQYIIIHHTGWWSYSTNLSYLSEWKAQASVHFVIWENEEVWKIWDPQNILWHAWTSEWWNLIWMNKYSLWIEVVWYWKYNTNQLIRLTDLVEYLMWVYNIPREKILRHCDITQRWDFSKKKILRDWKRSSRKVDISPDFFPMWFETRRNQLKPRKESRYK